MPWQPGRPAPTTSRSNLRRAIACGVAVLAAVTSTGFGIERSDAVGSTTPVRTVSFASMVVAFRPTVDDARRLATGFDTVVVQPSSLDASTVAVMRAANPAVEVLAYINGAFGNYPVPPTYPAAWFRRGATGAIVSSTATHNPMMDTTQPGWIADRVAACRAAIARIGANGCMLDMMGVAPLDPGYLDAIPVDPKTEQPLGDQVLLAANSNLIAAVRRSVEPAVVIANGLGGGPRYFPPIGTGTLLSPSDGAIFETWLRLAGSPLTAFPVAKVWQLHVDALRAAQQTGKHAITLVKAWAPGTQAEIDRWHKFSLASFLLATDGSSSYEFSSSRLAAGVTVPSPWDRPALGAPTGGYTTNGRWFQRNFSSGVVVVNPYPSAVTIGFPGTLSTLSGVKTTSLVLGAYSGEVLVR